MNERQFLHSGDLGDIIAALPTIRALGGGDLVISDVDGKSNRERMRGERYESIKPLLESQPYITSVRWRTKPTHITHDLSTFRFKGYVLGQSLVDWQAKHLGVEPDYEPWLTVEPRAINLPIINRTSRYQNPRFPWHLIVKKFDDAVFAGLPSEHEKFENDFGVEIDYMATPTVLDLAQLVAGASMIIANQSLVMWLALGLGKPIIQETWLEGPNCILPRSNARYTRTVKETNKLIESLSRPRKGDRSAKTETQPKPQFLGVEVVLPYQ